MGPRKTNQSKGPWGKVAILNGVVRTQRSEDVEGVSHAYYLREELSRQEENKNHKNATGASKQ